MTRIGVPECPRVYGYLSMEKPDETQIASWRADMRLFCRTSGYHLESVYIDRGVEDSSFMRAGFVDLVFALRSTDTSGVVVPTLSQLSSDDFVRRALVRMVELSGGRVLVTHAVNGRSPDVDLDTATGSGS